MRIVHLITHLRLGAGRAVVDLAVRQARDCRHTVVVALADDAEGAWQSDATLVRELGAGGVVSTTMGDFFHGSRRRWPEAPTAGNTAPHRARGYGRPCPHRARRRSRTLGRRPADRGDVPRMEPARSADCTLQDASALPTARRRDRVAVGTGPGRCRHRPGDTTLMSCRAGFDLARYPPSGSAQRPADTLRIACVAELTARKGQDLLLDAMPAVWD